MPPATKSPAPVAIWFPRNAAVEPVLPNAFAAPSNNDFTATPAAAPAAPSVSVLIEGLPICSLVRPAASGFLLTSN